MSKISIFHKKYNFNVLVKFPELRLKIGYWQKAIKYGSKTINYQFLCISIWSYLVSFGLKKVKKNQFGIFRLINLRRNRNFLEGVGLIYFP